VQLERPGAQHCWLDLYFDSAAHAALARHVLVDDPRVRALSVRHLTTRDWDAMWKQHFRRHLVGRRLEVCPHWEAGSPVPEGRVRLEVYPGMSFGTGEHFTTRFCLETIEELCQKSSPRTLLDVGTGSGILAVAAALLGIEHVEGTDLDEVILGSARHHARRNGVAARIEFRVEDVREMAPTGRFDIVCANLYASVLFDGAPALVRATDEHLVVTGLRDAEADGVAAAFAGQGAREVARDGNGEWVGLLFDVERT
jgi:ribosomal protein L11 methyltransferase